MKIFLARFAMISCLALTPAFSMAGDLKPRAEINFRTGTDRSILMTEFWAPLAQQKDRVLYGDLRLMGDDGDNREGNLGFGYRQISLKTNSVLGANAWIDRRRTENGNHFHQLTLGLESLGKTIDMRANGYIQLNSAKTKITPNIGNANPYLTGTGIFYDTNGFIIEEPQDGFDAEIGYRLPVWEKYIDSTRVYAGGYHFWGDTTDNVTGFRLRGEAQINSVFSIGARFQHDDPRGSQGFLEATLRFPFSAKKSFQKEGLRSRLDESPERDIDIVTGAKVDTGLMKPVINTASGTQQRILYVDNTNSNSGDGSKENPFNTLAAAQTALQENDILYVNHGDGTTTGMNQGIVIDKANVQFIGSGSALTYQGFTLLEAGFAPIITNIITPIDSLDHKTGNGVLVTADKVFISGITVSGAAHNGIQFLADGESFTESIVTNVTTTLNARRGIILYAINGGIIENATVTNSASNQNQNIVSGNGRGIEVRAEGENSRIENAVVMGNSFDNNTNTGISVISSTNGYIANTLIESNIITGSQSSGIGVLPSGNIGSLVIRRNTITNSNIHGIQIQGTGARIDSIALEDNIVTGSTNNGVYVFANAASTFNNVSLSGGSSTNNGGVGIQAIASANSTIGQIAVNNTIASFNATQGVLITTTNATGNIGSARVSNTTTNNNGSSGVYIYANNGTINEAVIENMTANNNIYGIYLSSNSAGKINKSTISYVTAINNTLHGMYVLANATASVLDRVSISHSNLINNATDGIRIQMGVAGATLNVDMGNGAYGSTGQNRIFGNTGSDLYISRVTNVIAGSNWWNNGGAAPSRFTLTNGATATYPTPLASDPRP